MNEEQKEGGSTTLSVHIDFDTESGELSLRHPENIRFGIGAVHMALAQMYFKLGEYDAINAQIRMQQMQKGRQDGIRVVKDLPDGMKSH